jgi:hypothetical protein
MVGVGAATSSLLLSPRGGKASGGAFVLPSPARTPHDPKDKKYYAKYGYEGGEYGVAAHVESFPKGTLMRIPGYRSGEWQEVDSKGGGVIRRAARKGYHQIDVKFKTHQSAKQWGSRWMYVEVWFDPE